MITSFRHALILTILSILVFNLSNAQPREGKFIEGSVGFGLVVPLEDFDIETDGFYLQGEYVMGITTWFGVRPYTGVILSSGDVKNQLTNETTYSIKSNAFLIGIKTRLCAPIPWVAPYFEVGIGASIGSLETFTPYTNLEKSGVLSHIPFSLGLAIGKQHRFEIEFCYYYHNAVEQFSGAFAFGYAFPLD